MVQVIQLKNKRQPTDWGQALVGAIGMGSEAYGKYKQKQALQGENKSLKEQGINVEGLTGETRKLVLEHQLKELGKKKADQDFYKQHGILPEGEPKNPYEDMGTPSSEIESPNQNRLTGSLKGQKPFSINDPESWSDKQVSKFRAGSNDESPKAKAIAKEAEIEYERRKELKKATIKYNEDIGGYRGALETIDRMEQISKKNNLGIGSSYTSVFNPEARKDIGEYEQLGKSLISYASKIPIRNQREFDTLSHDVFDSSLSDAKRAGILESMRRIIQDSLKTYTNPNANESEESGMMQQAQERPPLTSFMR